MAEDLGEVRVNVESEGAEEAADTIGDAVGGDGAGGGGDSVGGLLGGISAKLAGILGFVAFLASLKPIQEILSGLQRLFSVAILPLVSLLTTFLRPVLQKLLRFIGSLDFNNLFVSLARQVGEELSGLADGISTSISNTIPGVGSSQADVGVRRGGELALSGLFPTFALGKAVDTGFNINLDWLNEQSNTSLERNAGETSATVSQRNTTGSE